MLTRQMHHGFQYQENKLKGKLKFYLHREHLHDAAFQVLMKFLKLLKDVIFLASSGKEFQSLAAWNLKLFVPYLVLLVLGISKRFEYLKL